MKSPDFVERAHRLSAEVLQPDAEAVDQSVVRRSSLDAIAAAGLYGIAAPGAATPAGIRAVVEALAGGCGATSFVWSQHHTSVRMLSVSDNATLRDARLPALVAGDQRAGVAFAHVRRPGPPALLAVPDGAGWRLRGEVPWLTGWDLVDTALVAATTADARLVWTLLPTDTPGLAPSAPLALVAMAATRTVRCAFRDVAAPSDLVVRVVAHHTWLAEDELTTPNVNPAVFGVAETALRHLATVEPEVADRMRSRIADCRTAAGVLADDLPPGERLPERRALRAEAMDLALECAQAFVIATGGRAMALTHPAQRLAREALFYLVQAQTAAGRKASLARRLSKLNPT